MTRIFQESHNPRFIALDLAEPENVDKFRAATLWPTNPEGHLFHDGEFRKPSHLVWVVQLKTGSNFEMSSNWSLRTKREVRSGYVEVKAFETADTSIWEPGDTIKVNSDGVHRQLHSLHYDLSESTGIDHWFLSSPLDGSPTFIAYPAYALTKVSD